MSPSMDPTMEFLTELWLPILVSAVFVFVASSLVHMVLKYHAKDYGKLANEDEIMDFMREKGVSEGQYALPSVCSMAELAEPETIAKFEKGPVAFINVMPSGPPTMGKALFYWFLYSVLVSIFCGYIGWFSLGAGAHYLEVFRITGTVAVLAYGFAVIPESIWKGQSWVTTCRFILDGIIYGLVTAGAFGWLWPSLPVPGA